jgi:mRNA interferase RelE/StbE
MTGYKNYFKIRFGNYRVGIKKENDSIIIETVKHRREIYNYFP